MHDNMLMQNSNGFLPSDPAAIAAAESAKARIQAKFIMAFQKRRSEDDARDAILRACKRPAFAERVEYAKPVGGKSIKGLSIRFAETAGRLWGNLDTDVQVVYENENIRRTRITTTDLETNVGYGQEIVVTKTVERKKAGPDREILGERVNTYGETVYIVRTTDEEMTTKENAQFSKIIRNQILRVMPADILDEARETALTTMRNKASGDPEAARKKILDSFSSIGVRPRDIKQYLGHEVDLMTPKELEELRGIYSAIKDGEATWLDYSKDIDAESIDTSVFDNLIAAKAKEGTDGNAIQEFISQSANSLNLSIEATKVKAGEDFNQFWLTYQQWLSKQQGNGKDEEPDEWQAVRNEFINLRNPDNFRAYEEKHRAEIPGWPEWLQKDFNNKWQRKFDETYKTYLTSLNQPEQEQPEPPQAEPEGKGNGGDNPFAPGNIVRENRAFLTQILEGKGVSFLDFKKYASEKLGKTEDNLDSYIADLLAAGDEDKAIFTALIEDIKAYNPA